MLWYWSLHSILLTTNPLNSVLLTHDLWVTYYWPLHSELLTPNPCTLHYIQLNSAFCVIHSWPLNLAILIPDPCNLLTYSQPLNSAIITPDACLLQYSLPTPALCNMYSQTRHSVILLTPAPCNTHSWPPACCNTYSWPLHSAIFTPGTCILQYPLVVPALCVIFSWPMHHALLAPKPFYLLLTSTLKWWRDGAAVVVGGRHMTAHPNGWSRAPPGVSSTATSPCC